MKKIYLLALLVVSIGFVFAMPSIPDFFSGEVTYSAEPLKSLSGYDITASVGGSGLGVVGVVESGNVYSLMIDPEGKYGEIVFYIGGVEALPVSSYTGGEFVELDLVINEVPLYGVCGNGIREAGEMCDDLELGVGTCENVLGILGSTGTLSCTPSCTFDYSNCSAPFCGDGSCSDQESCINCAADCGSCNSVSSSSGGSSSGSGGSSGGSAGGVSYSASSSSSDDEPEEEIETQSLSEPESVFTQTEPNNFFSAITGAVIGGGTASFAVAGAFILLALGAFGFVQARKRDN